MPKPDIRVGDKVTFREDGKDVSGDVTYIGGKNGMVDVLEDGKYFSRPVSARILKVVKRWTITGGNLK